MGDCLHIPGDYSSGGREGHLMARLVWMPKVALGKILKCYIRAIFVHVFAFPKNTHKILFVIHHYVSVFNRADEVLGSYAALRFVRLLPAASRKNKTI